MKKFEAHILVVDDDDGIRDLVKKYLNDNNFLVTTAVNSKDAGEKINTIKFDLIVLDIMMPGETGLEFISRNNDALEILKKKHKVDIRQYPDEVLEELYNISKIVVKELSLKDDFAMQVYESYSSFQKKTTNWNEISIKPYLNILE